MLSLPQVIDSATSNLEVLLQIRQLNLVRRDTSGRTFAVRLLSSISPSLGLLAAGFGGAAAAFSAFLRSASRCFCLFLSSDFETRSPVTSSRCRLATSCVGGALLSAILSETTRESTKALYVSCAGRCYLITVVRSAHTNFYNLSHLRGSTFFGAFQTQTRLVQVYPTPISEAQVYSPRPFMLFIESSLVESN